MALTLPPGILGRPLPETERVFGPGVIDAEGDHDAVLPDVNAINQQRHEVEGIECRRSPGGELRLGLRDEPTAHRALARTPRADIGARGFEAAAVLPCRDADEHLLDHATVQ